MSNSYTKLKHDIGVTNTNGDVVGLMLAQKPDGTPAYAVFDRKHLADQFFTGTPAQTYQDPEVEIPLSQYSWRAGMGLKVFDPSDPERYYRAKNMDLRNRGEAIASYQPSNVAISPATDAIPIVSANFETLAGWNWSDTTIFQTNVAGHDSINTNVLNIYRGVSALNAVQYLAGWTPGVTYIVNCWAHNIENRDDPKLFIDDGVSSVSAPLVNGNWQKVSVTKTIDQSAQYVRVAMYSGTTGGTTDAIHWDEITARVVNTTSAVAVNGVIRSVAEHNSTLHFGMGEYLTKLNSDGDKLLTMQRYSQNITRLQPFTDDSLYVCLNTETNYARIPANFAVNGSSISNASANVFEFMELLHGVSPTMYGNDDVNKLRSTTDPTNGGVAWSDPPTNVGDSAHRITRLLAGGGTLYMFKQDKPYYLDSSGNVQEDLAEEFETLFNEKSGKAALYWNGKVYIPATSHLMEIDGSTKTWLSPSKFITDLPEYGRDIQALAGDEEWLYQVVGGNGINVEFMAGRYESVGGSTDWRWHPLRTLDMTNCETSFVSSIYKRRHWVSSTNASDPLYFIPLPDSYGNIKDDAQRNFDSGGYFHTPRLHGDFRLTLKAYTKLELELGHDFDADIYFEAHYNTLNNSIWTAIGDFKGNSDTRIATGYLPLNPADTMLQLNLCANTDDNQKTPSLIGYNLTAILYPPRKDIIACTVRAAQGVQTKDVLSSKYESIKLALDNARDATRPVKIFDIHGDPINVKFLPLPSGTPWISLYKDERSRQTELRYNLLLQEIDIG